MSADPEDWEKLMDRIGEKYNLRKRSATSSTETEKDEPNQTP